MPKRLHKSRPDHLVRLHVAEPAPLGLFGLAMGCLILMFVDFEVTAGKLMLIPWLFLLPASLQFIAGVFDFMRHNHFGGTAFLGYSMVWYGLAAVYYLEITYSDHPDLAILIPSDSLPARQHTAIIFIGYLIFSLVLTIISLGINRILLSILVSIDYTFLVLVIHVFEHEKCPPWVAGIGLVMVFLTAIYGFIAILLLKVAGGEVLPIGKALCNFHKHIIHDPDVPEESSTRSLGVTEDDNVKECEILVTKSTQPVQRRVTNGAVYQSVGLEQGV